MSQAITIQQSGDYLFFVVNHKLYSIPTIYVQEILWLPELSYMNSMPDYIIGSFYNREELILVVDLDIKQGIEPSKANINDRIIIIEKNQSKLGLRISEIRDVQYISLEEIQIFTEYKTNNSNSITNGIIKNDFEVAHIIQPDYLFKENWNPISTESETVDKNKFTNIFNQLSSSDAKLFHQRRLNYSKLTSTSDLSGTFAIAVIKLSDEYLGIDLKYILEFAEINSLTEIPCTPKHIAGCMNLRGDIFILLDLHYILKGIKNPNPEKGNVLVSKKDELIIGMIVDDLYDVIYIDKNLLVPAPSMVREANNELIKESCVYNNITIGILNIEKLLEEKKLYVEEVI
jgi:purine-binding chemotaxis protein CheW